MSEEGKVEENFRGKGMTYLEEKMEIIVGMGGIGLKGCEKIGIGQRKGLAWT